MVVTDAARQQAHFNDTAFDSIRAFNENVYAQAQLIDTAAPHVSEEVAIAMALIAEAAMLRCARLRDLFRARGRGVPEPVLRDVGANVTHVDFHRPRR